MSTTAIELCILHTGYMVSITLMEAVGPDLVQFFQS